jgi:ABC-2 type transport system ATP-binding protein
MTQRQPTGAQPPSSPQSADVAVDVHDASARFGAVEALSGISFAVPYGTILGLIGPSGSGKTTTVRVLTGAVHPHAGRVRVLGSDPRTFSRAVRERIGYMPQLFVLYPDLTARENVDVMGALFGMLWRRRRARTRKVLEAVELWDVRDRRASRLSGGMQRRLELACALVHDPQLLFLDEPTAGIDPLLRRSIWGELRRLRDSGRTLLVTTQTITEAEHCDAVALISEGRLIALAPPDELRRQALGGDIIQVETAQPFDPRLLAGVSGVRAVRSQGLRDLQVVVDDAGAGTPAVIEAVERGGGQVAASREVKPSFDEVFTVLVERHRAAAGSNGEGQAA